MFAEVRIGLDKGCAVRMDGGGHWQRRIGGRANHGWSGRGTTAETVTQPVTRTSLQVYETLVGSVQWYVEQWEDLVVEAKASLASNAPSPTVAEVLAGLAEATVASAIPGRVRWRLKQLKGHDRLAEQGAQALGRLPGIRQVEVSALTGSVLIFYDTAKYASRDALARALAAQG